MSGAGAAVGLILGGWLTGTSLDVFGTSIDGWRLTLLINTPIGLAAAALAPKFLAESESHPGELDVPGALTGTFGLLGLVYGLSRAATNGWSDAVTLTTLIAGIAVLAIFGVIESRAEHPLLPFRIFLHRTRASSFVAMMLLPAAMFAMFFYLSQYIQNVMGYSPLHAGLAFLPFSAGIIVAAGISSSLVNRIDPRWLAGTGTLMAAVALYGFSRIPSDTSIAGGLNDVSASYATDILPFIVLMSLGMGATFVPVTLTAVHHLRSEDSGIGSGVLNTMQQVGGALGLATLSTFFAHVFKGTTQDVVAQAGKQGQQFDPTTLANQAFANGASTAFLVGSVMALAGSLVIWLFLNVKHTELATDGPEDVPVHVG
jgi:predicted MFS family arabinose efflux permease